MLADRWPGRCLVNFIEQSVIEQLPDLRQLDAVIASAVFPALGNLPVLGTGVWRHEDGSRVPALRYTASRAAAATLVPAVCWLEDGGHRAARVCGDKGEWEGIHSVEEIAICMAALEAGIEMAQFPA